MADLTDAGENLTAEALTDEPWIKLHTGAPGEAGTSNAAGETKRKKAVLGAASGGKRQTTADLEWKEVSTAETITHVSVWTAESGGTCEWVAALAASKALSVGDTLKIVAGQLSFTLA